MSGKRQTPKPQENPRLFSKGVVVFNLLFMAWFCARCLQVTEVTSTSTGDMIASATLFFGGELFVLAGKQVLEKRKKKEEPDHD